MSLLDSLSIGVNQIAQGLSADRLAKASARRLRAIGAQDAALRALQGTQLLGTQKVQQAAQGVAGPVTERLAETTFEQEEIDVGRTRFVNEALADQVEKQGKAQKFASILGLSTTFTDAKERFAREQRLKDLERAVAKSRTKRARGTAVGGGIPRLGVDPSDFEGFA